MKSKKIVIIEPAANVSIGHMREKLEVIISVAEDEGFKVFLVTWENPTKIFQTKNMEIKVVGKPLRKILNILPEKLRARYVDFCTYYTGFRYAKKLRLPVIGMTSCDPWGPLAASYLGGIPMSFLLRMLHPGVFFHEGKYSVSKRRLTGFARLARRGTQLVLFNQLLKKTCASMLKQLERDRVHVIPELMNCPTIIPSVPGNKRNLLVSGFDNERRKPLWHLEKIKDYHGILDEVILQHPTLLSLEEFCSCWSSQKSDWKISLISDYLTGESWQKIFVEARYTLIAYDQNFTQSSGIFLQSIAYGRPVISTKFPDALDLFEKHGKLGVLFDYLNPKSLISAMEEITHWDITDWSEFYAAREKLIYTIDSKKVFREYCGILHL